MPDDTRSTTDAVVATVEHALRLHAKIKTLEAARLDALATAGSLAGELGEWMDYATYYRLAQELRDADIPGRGSFTGGKKLPPPPGTVIRRRRSENEPPWPTMCPCVYVLINAAGEVIYIGKSKHVPARITQHRAKPWEWAEVIVCESEAAALALEGDLIFQHQPELNRAGRWQRPAPGAEPIGEIEHEGDYPAAQRFAEDWRLWAFDGDPAPLPHNRELEKSLKTWMHYGDGLTLAELMDLIPAALDRDGIRIEDRWRYYCGVAWNHAKERA